MCPKFFITAIPGANIKRKKKVGIDGEKSAQISIAAKTVTKRWLQIMIMEPKQATHYNYFDVFSLLCSHYVIDMIKKLELHLLVDIISLKIEFGHIRISVPKIGTPMLKTACINSWILCLLQKSFWWG